MIIGCCLACRELLWELRQGQITYVTVVCFRRMINKWTLFSDTFSIFSLNENWNHCYILNQISLNVDPRSKRWYTSTGWNNNLAGPWRVKVPGYDYVSAPKRLRIVHMYPHFKSNTGNVSIWWRYNGYNIWWSIWWRGSDSENSTWVYLYMYLQSVT